MIATCWWASMNQGQDWWWVPETLIGGGATTGFPAGELHGEVDGPTERAPRPRRNPGKEWCGANRGAPAELLPRKKRKTRRTQVGGAPPPPGGGLPSGKTRKTQGARFGRIGERKGGAAAAWWAAERVEPPWIGPVTDRTYATGRREAGWMCRRYHIGKNKQVFDAELYALHQAVQIFDERNEQSQCYTILSDSTERARSDEMGLGQRFAVAIIEVCSRLTSQGKL